VTPNHLTTIRLISGLAAAFAFAEGTNSGNIAGAVLFLISMLFDRADGELARLSGKTSAFGHSYDLVTDSLCNSLLFVGIGFGLADQNPWAISLGFIAGSAVSAILWLVLRSEAKEGQHAAALGGNAGFDADDAIAVVPLTVAAGYGLPLLYAAAIGAPAFALYFFWRFRSNL